MKHGDRSATRVLNEQRLSMHRSDRTPRVVFQPETHQALGRGIAQIADAVRPTLGPGARSVMIGREAVEQPPMLFDSGGLIARRIVEIRNRDEDMGAMLLRDMLWHLHQEVGDGTATAAVMCEAIYRHGVRYLAAGGNVIRLRRYLETGSDTALALLAEMSIPVAGRELLGCLAESSCHDPDLAKLLGETLTLSVSSVTSRFAPVTVGDWNANTSRACTGKVAFWPANRLRILPHSKPPSRMPPF